MTKIIAILFLLITGSALYSQSFADRSAVKFLTGLMFYEKESNDDKLGAGFFIGAELEFPLNPKGVGASFVPYVVPEVNYWAVENRKNVALGVNLRGKFKAGSTRPYIDFGITFNELSRGGDKDQFGGINAGAGIDIILEKSNISIVIDFKVRAHIMDEKIKAGFSLTPGIRVAI
jgi:hypothetical protein